MFKNQKGFSVVEGLLVFVIIGIIGGVGYYVYQSQQETKKSQDNSNKSSLEIDAEKKEDTTPVAKKYFEIKELGVKFEQPDSLKDLYYHIGNNGNTAFFSLNEFKGTDCAADKIAQVIVVKTTAAEHTAPDGSPSTIPTQKLGDHLFYTSGGQAGCSEDAAMQAKATKLKQDVVSATKDKLELIK
jgi:Tfp pilus assembly protein PilE